MQHLDPHVGGKARAPELSRMHADASAFQQLDIGSADDFASGKRQHPGVLRVPQQGASA
ncbi:hypothetical protein D3C85_1440380 [compost metagenome]